MVQSKTKRLGGLLISIALVFTNVLHAPRFSDVTLDETTPCRKIASAMQQQVDAIGYPAKLACLGKSTMRYAGAGLTDYMNMAGTAADRDEAKGVWAASAPVQHGSSYKLSDADAFVDVAMSGDGSLIAAAAGSEGLLVYNKNYNLLKRFTLAELGMDNGLTTNPTVVNSVSFHATRPWLAVGTTNATASENVTTLNLESTNPQDWAATLVVQATASHGAGVAINSVRFSPDGNYLTTSSMALVKTVDVTSTHASWALSADFAAPAITDSLGHISWSCDSQKYALVAGGTAVAVADKYAAAVSAIGSGLTAPLTFTSPQGVAFNCGCKKLAVIEADTLKIVDASDVDATMWDTFKENDGTTEFSIAVTGDPALTNVLFHPSVDIVAATNDATGMNYDLHMFDVRNRTPQKENGDNAWVELSTPSIFPYKVDSVNAVSTRGLAWNKFGTQLVVGTSGLAMSAFPRLVTIDTHHDDLNNWAELQRLQYHTQDVTVVATSAGSLLATGEDTMGGIVTLWDTTNDVQRRLATIGVGQSLPIVGFGDVKAMIFSSDSKYLFIAYGPAASELVAINISNPVAPTVAATVTLGTEANSIAVTRLRINNGAGDALTGTEPYFVAVGNNNTGGPTTTKIEFRAFDGAAFSTTNLATIGNGFGLHTYMTGANVPIRVAMRDDRLVTSGKFDNSGSDDPNVKVWNVQTFVNKLLVDINTAPASAGLNPVAILDITDPDLSSDWPAATKNITSIDVSADRNAIAMADEDKIVYISNILVLTDPKSVDKTTAFTAAVQQVRFSPNSKFGSATDVTKRDGYLGVALDAVEIGGNALVYDLATTSVAAILDAPVQAYELPVVKTGSNTINSFDWGRKGYKLYAGGADAVVTQYHINTAVAAMAQLLVNNYNPKKGPADQGVAEESAKDLARLSGIDIDGNAAKLADVEDAIASALLYLSTNAGDVFGAARALQRSFESASDVALSDLNLATIAANRYATFSGAGLFEKAHLLHPVDLAVECDNKLDLSRQYTRSYGEKIFRHLRQYQGILGDTQLIAQASEQPQNRFFTALTNVADSKGVKSAEYVAGLGYPIDQDTTGIAKELAVASHDFATETTESNVGLAGSKSATDALRRLREQHFEDRMCRAAAQHAQNYLNFGKDLIDCMGLLPVDKVGAQFAVTKDVAWAYNDQYLFVAAGEVIEETDGGLLVFDRDCNFITCIPAADLGGQTESSQPSTVTSITTHPFKPWIAIGTNDATADENVVVLDFSSDDPKDWICTKTTIPAASHAAGTEILSLRFSPDGKYLVSTVAVAATKAKAVKVTDQLEQWVNPMAAEAFGSSNMPVMTATSTGHIAWKKDSSLFAVVTEATKYGFASNLPTAASGVSPVGATNVTGVAFNADGTKFALTNEDRVFIADGNDIGNITILSVSAVATVGKSGTGAHNPRLSNPIFHPTEDILVVTDEENFLDSSGGPAVLERDAQDVRVFDLRGANTSKWFELNSLKHGGKFPFIMSTSKLSDDNGIINKANFGLAWNKLGTKLAVGNNKLQAVDNKADLVVFSTNSSHASKWNCKRANFSHDESYRLSKCVFNALRVTSGELLLGVSGSCLNGVDLAFADEAALNTAVDALDFKKVAPLALTKNLRAQIAAATVPFATVPTDGNNTDVYTAALAGALIGQGYADAAFGASSTIAAIATKKTDVEDLLKRENVGTDTGSLPKGSFYALRGDRLNPSYYDAAGVFDPTKSFTGVADGPGPDKDGVSGAGQWGAYDSVLHGPFVTLGSYLDALYNDVMTPVNGLVANVDSYSTLTTKEKQVVGRAILLRTLMTGSEIEARELFDGTTDPFYPVKVATLIRELMRVNNFSIYSSPTDTTTGTSVVFGALDDSVRQEIAAVAVLYGNDGAGIDLEADITEVNALLQNAYDAATYIPCPSTSDAKNKAIQKEMALLGGLARASYGTTVNFSVGKELARGLLSGEQLQGLANEDLGSIGQDGICVDLSEPLMAAVVACTALEKVGVEQGSFACGLAYNQLFRTDSVARAVAKLVREYSNETFGREAALFSAVSLDPTPVEVEEILQEAVGHENLSRARYAVARKYEQLTTLETAALPHTATDHAVNLIENHIVNIMRYPASFALNLNKVPVFTNKVEPVLFAPHGHPQDMSAELLSEFAQLSAAETTAVACDVYSSLNEECSLGVDAAGQHCQGLTPDC